MGVRLFTDAARLSMRGLEGTPGSEQTGRTGGGGRINDAISGNYKFSVIYDGGAGKQGLPAELAANEIWVDPLALFRPGLDTGPRFQNMGPTTCVIYGCMGPRNYAYQVTGERVTELAPYWNTIATLAPGEVATVDAVYSLLRYVFTADAGKPGQVVALTL